MQHLGFIFASYLSTGLILAVLAVWLVFDHRKQKNALQALETRGVRRRSGTSANPTAAPKDSKQVTR